MKALNLIGQRFGRLTVLSKESMNKYRKITWLCKCDCGREKIIVSGHLRSGHTKSCGCLAKEQSIKNGKKNITHGMRNTNIYITWIQMVSRCKNKKSKSYHNYGARGITVCKRWLRFKNFYTDMGDRPVGLTLERKNNNKGYSPDNCKWATRKEQNNNSRGNVLIEYKGLKLTMAQWAEKLGISKSILRYRIRDACWPIKRAFNESVLPTTTLASVNSEPIDKLAS